MFDFINKFSLESFKNTFNKVLSLLIQYSPLLIIFSILLISSTSFGAELQDVIKSYNAKMMNNIGDKFLNIDMLSWRPSNGSSVVRLLFQITFLIALVNALRAIGQDMLMKLFDLALYMVIALALLGEPTAYRIFQPVFQFSTTKKNADGSAAYSYDKSKGGSLDRDIYMYLSYAMDGLAEQAFGEDVQMDLYKASVAAGDFVQRVIDSQLNCKIDGDRVTFQNCALMYLKAGNDAKAAAELAEKEKADQLAEKEASESYNPSTVLSYYASKVKGFLAQLVNPFAWFFPFLLWLFDIIRSAINLFLLIGFGIMTAFSLFMAKLFVPFLLLPSQRSIVIKALKVPLSATMWGFVTSLIIFMSFHITDSMTSAGTKTMIEQIEKSGSLDVKVLVGVLSSMFLTQLVIAAIQIVALFKVPKISEDILNFSLAPVVGLGGELISASAGIVKMIGAVAMPAAAAAGSLAGSAMGSAKSAGAGMVAGALGEEKMNSIRSKVTSFTGTKGPSGGSGSGGGTIGNIGAMKAAKDSVDSGYKDFQQSRQNQPQEGGRTKLGKLIDGATAVGGAAVDLTKKAGSVAGKMGSEAGNLALDATTGNYSGMQNRVMSGLNDASGALIGGANQTSSMLDSQRENIASKAKSATSKVFSRFHDSSQAQRAQVASTMSQAMAQKELAGEDATKFKAFESRMAAGEILTAEDTQFMTSMQNVNLNESQQKTMSDAISRQYDSAAESNDYESMLKLSNNKFADGNIVEKNRMNRDSLKDYDKYIKDQEARIAKLVKEASSGKSKNINTVNSQQELLESIKNGFAKQQVMNQPASDSGTTVRQAIRNQQAEDVKSNVNDLVNKEQKSSVDFNELKRISEENKFLFKDTGTQDAINKELAKVKMQADFTAKQMDSTVESMSANFGKNLSSGSGAMQFDNSKINVGADGFLDSSTFTDSKGKTQSISKISGDAIFAIREELKQYDKYLQEYNKEKEKNPDYSINEKTLENTRNSANALRKLLTDIENSKKKK